MSYRNSDITARRLVAVQVLAAFVLAACGGGGSAPLPPPPPPPPPHAPAVIPAVETVPEPVGYSAEELEAFNALNAARASIGLGLVSQDVRLDGAIDAHVGWEVINYKLTHLEIPNTPGFYGADILSRLQKSQYNPSQYGETLSIGITGRRSIDAVIGGFYHRQVMLGPEYVDVGLTLNHGDISTFIDAAGYDLAMPSDDDIRRFGQDVRPGTDLLIEWPKDGAVDVFQYMGNEVPNPVPTSVVTDLGYAVTVTCVYWKTLQTSNFSLLDATDNKPVAAQVLTSDSDPQGLARTNFAGLIPLHALIQNHNYTATFSGLIDGESISRTWNFQVGGRGYPGSQ